MIYRNIKIKFIFFKYLDIRSLYYIIMFFYNSTHFNCMFMKSNLYMVNDSIITKLSPSNQKLFLYWKFAIVP